MISVVIPVYNGARFLGPAIRSTLLQTLPPDEVIVADDGSDDDSAGIAGNFGDPVRVLRLPHRGGAAALNSALAEARGDILAFLDADDLWAVDKLAFQTDALTEDLAAIFGRVVNFNDPDCAITDPGQIAEGLPSMVGASKDAMLIRREAFNRVGLFDETFPISDFPEWYSRAMQSDVRMGFPDRVVAFRRIHRTNVTRVRRDELHRDYVRLARQAISRRTVADRPV